MASFDRAWAYATLSICHCKYSCNHVPFLRYLTLKNILTMKSSLGITHPANLYTIAEIYRPRVIFLPLIVRDDYASVLHSLVHNELRKKLDEVVHYGCPESFKVIEILVPFHVQITIVIVHCCDAMSIFYRFRDITIYWLKICIFCCFHSPQSLLKPQQESFLSAYLRT